MAELPSRQEIDDMVELIGGPSASFDNLSPTDRIAIVGLTINNNIVDVLDNIDGTLSHVSRWFELSKLYEGQ